MVAIALFDLDHFKDFNDRFGELDQLGIKVVLDDFGSGYSSLSNLMRYSVTGLKIDRSLVGPLPQCAEARAAVEASIILGRNLGLEVVAEGVERADQLAFLRQLGCLRAQGPFLSDAVTPDVFGRLLREGPPLPGPRPPRPRG